jgi:hypothetical protein
LALRATARGHRTAYAEQKRAYRDHTQVSAFFDGPELVEPGVVGVPAWHPETEAAAKAPTLAWCGVGRKPSAA